MRPDRHRRRVQRRGRRGIRRRGCSRRGRRRSSIYSPATTVLAYVFAG